MFQYVVAGKNHRHLQQSWRCRWSEVGHVCSEAEAVRSHFSNPSSAEAACEACCLPGGMHLESVNSTSTKNADSCQLGLDQERRSVADRLDRAPIHCRELAAADQVWMQVGMVDANASALVWPARHCARHCAAADARFSCVVVYLLRQQDNKWETSIGLLPTCTSNNISDWWRLWYGHFLP